MEKKKQLTAFQIRALKALLSKYPEPIWPENLYPVLFPNGRFNTDVDYGSSKGGPSRRQCAVNWHLSKLGPLARRDLRDGGRYGGWIITNAGRAALRNEGIPA